MKGGSFIRERNMKGGNEQTEGAPHFAVVVLDCNHALEEIDRLSV